MNFDPSPVSGTSFDRTMTRRTALKTAGASAAVLSMLGAPGVTTARAVLQETPQSGGTAVMAVNANPLSWDVTKATWPTWEALIHMYDRLLTFNELEELQPSLATEWSVSEDGLEYTVVLRNDVNFHDGEPFNAEAVKFNIQRHIDLPDSTWYSTYEPVERMDVVDDYTLKIVLKEVRPLFAWEGFAMWGAAQISPKAYAEQEGNYGNPPVGTGPFKFDSYEAGAVIRYVRNDAYWGGAPLLEGLQVRIIPEPSVQALELEAGTIDAILILPKDVQTLQDAGAIIAEEISPGAVLISLNVSQPPTDELAVRKAIALAIDRDTIIESVNYGYGEKSRAGVNSASPYYSEDVPMIEYNPDEAARLLDEAGWVAGDDGVRARDGQPLSVKIFSTDFAGWGLYNQIIQEQLQAIGITSEITSLEWNAYLDQWRENQGGWNVSYHQQGSIMAVSSPIQASWAPDDYWTVTQIDDATAPDLIPVRDQLQALSDEFLVTVDEARRKEIAVEAQTIFQENQLAVWLWHEATIHAFLDRLKDTDLTHAGRIVEFNKAWLA